jgi:hypothetical protein
VLPRSRTMRRGKHRTEVTEATEGDGGGGRRLRGEHLGVRCENDAKRKASHGGHGGHGGDWVAVDEGSVANILASGARTMRIGKHRTEVTEATEGIGWRWTKAPWRTSWRQVREHANRKASHGGHGGHGGDWVAVDEGSVVNILASGARTMRILSNPAQVPKT